MIITFHASIHKISIDREGEGTLTLKIPASDLAGPISTITQLEKLLIVTIEEEKIQ